MLFRTSIPDRLQEHPNVSAFVSVLDALQSFKAEIISESLRVDNYALLMDKKWLLKYLAELGFTDIPLEYPTQIIQQCLLNADTLSRVRGSKIGLEFYCSLFSLGEVTIDDSEFFRDPMLILLDSPLHGYLTDDNSTYDYYLCDNSANVEPSVNLTVTIKSRFFNGDYPKEEALIKSYIETNIGKQLGFSPNREITFYYLQNTDFYYHKLLNPYFV